MDVGAMAAEAHAALVAYADEPGRSARVEVRIQGEQVWADGVAQDAPAAAASLLKLPLAIAVERAVAAGELRADAGWPVADLRAEDTGRSVLDVLGDPVRLSVTDLLGLMLCASDGPSASWLVGLVGIESVRAAVAAAGCHDTTVEPAVGLAAGPLAGTTTARDALRLLAAVVDDPAHRVSRHALQRSIRNSRIPLGADAADVALAHKTGSLPGVAHDVAVIESAQGSARLAFLTRGQHDTLVAGYAMGICTRRILSAWGLPARRTVSALAGDG